MDDNGEMGMDSFVDIVANTVGIVVILTMLVIANVGETTLKVDDTRREFAELRESYTATLSKIIPKSDVSLGSLESIQSTLAMVQEKGEETREALSSLEAEVKAFEGRASVARQQTQQLKMDLSAMDDQGKEWEAAIDGADEAVDELAEEVPEFSREELDAVGLADVRGVEAEVADLNSKATLTRSELERLKREAEGLRARKRELDRVVSDLRARTDVLVEVTSPESRRDLTRTPVWVECFTESPEEGVTEFRARLVDSANYARDAEVLKPVRSGDTMAELAGDDSALRRYLGGQDAEFLKDHVLHLLVRPDAFRAFREVRRVAREAGWDVQWSPIQSGPGLVIGGGD